LCSLSSLLEGSGKGLDTGETTLWVFGEGYENHFLDRRRDGWYFLTQWRRWGEYVLTSYFDKGSMKGTVASQPFVGDDAERILVTGRTGLALELFGSRVGECPCHILYATRA